MSSSATQTEWGWKRALVVGMGASGRAAAHLLRQHDVAVNAYDARARTPEDQDGARLRWFLGETLPPPEAFEGIDLLVLSPGVDPRPIRDRLAKYAPNAEIHGEMSLGLWCLRQHCGRFPTVLITGTNGKSTVTMLTAAMLGGRLATAGNIGRPVCEIAAEIATSQATPNVGSDPFAGLVIECSSYQLETLVDHPTDVAILLNVAPDHLDRYESMEDYADTKANVFSGLVDGGLALLLANDPWTARLRPTHGRVVEVDGDSPPHIQGERLCISEDESHPRDTLPIAGRHNGLNALFARLAARHLGGSSAECEAAMRGFAGLPHRMQEVGTFEGITYYDDSKATNVSAVVASLRGFPRPCVLIVGGRAKGEDLGPLRACLGDSVRGLVALGESRTDFLRIADGRVPSAEAQDMDDAVAQARAMARPGDAVLLSPACASWDMFQNFAHRGRVFARAVEAIGRA